MEAITYDLDYRAEDDDAWYTASVNLSEDSRTLEVLFEGLKAWNLLYTAERLKSLEEVDVLLKRFRPISIQLQDNECHIMIKGLKVCAALSCSGGGLRYYDAIVEEVQHEKHSFNDGKEECLCSFLLCWLHGPSSGQITLAKVADICLIQAYALANPGIISFCKLIKDRIQADCSVSSTVSKHCTRAKIVFEEPQSSKELIYTIDDNFSSKKRLEDTNVGNYPCKSKKEGCSCVGSTRGCKEGHCSSNSVNLGGSYFLLVGNLEKDLTTSSIEQFILGHTHVSPRVYLFPGRSSMPCCSGVIAADSKENIDKIYDFLEHPEHLIVSSTGRPLVVHENVVDRIDGSRGANLGGLVSKSPDEFQLPITHDLKVVYFGTNAYKKAKLLKKLFEDFLNHEQMLHHMFSLEETRIMKSSYLGETNAE